MRIWSASRFPTRSAVAAPAAAPMPAPFKVLSCDVAGVGSRTTTRGAGSTSGVLWLEHAGTRSPAIREPTARRRCEGRNALMPYLLPGLMQALRQGSGIANTALGRIARMIVETAPPRGTVEHDAARG